jgi:hypothetical protein
MICDEMHPYIMEGGGVMSRTEIVEVVLPDGSLVNAEVSIEDSITDVGVQPRLSLKDARKSVTSFVRWAVENVGVAEADAEGDVPPDAPDVMPSPPGMTLSRLGLEFGLKLAVKTGTLTSVIAGASGEATAIVRLEWERGSRERR